MYISDDKYEPKDVIYTFTGDGVDVKNQSRIMCSDVKVTVSDDKYEPKDVIYTFTGDGVDVKNQSRSKFGINSTSGEIYSLCPLDRDQPFGRPQWKLSVYAEDSKSGQLVGFADVIINLKDINDNPPVFAHKHFWANVTENGTIGRHVITLIAIDVDDPFDGSNARISYNIEDNQVNDSGELIFAIDSHTGAITTDVCCLDRESHSQYKIKVIASDGDGLKATTTVTITVTDVNDMPPKFTKHEWFAEIDEIYINDTSDELIQQMPILIVTVIDLDLFETNNFVFKIITNSDISERFSLTANSDSSASLRAIKSLDYEDMSQRNVNLTVGVSDLGDNFSDTYHTDYCVIHVRLRDINDNSPQFVKSNIEINVSEDTKLGSIVTKFHATDADQSGLSAIGYRIDTDSDKRKHFSIDFNGIIRLERSLDREKELTHKLVVWATDDGTPPLSSSATLTITVDDVNDNAPTLIDDYLSTIYENSLPQKVGEIFATDLDDASKGNGPPFTFKLDPMASDLIRDSFKIQYDPNGDGKAIVYSRQTFDREVEKQYLLPIVIKDNGFPSQTSTNTLTVVIRDVNDNHMRNGWKKITLFYIKNSDTKQVTRLGRVNVDDEDDWDLSDKSFFWFDHKSVPSFELDSKTGIISMRNITKGDYDLKFKVFDGKHKQEIDSRVRVEVIAINSENVLNSGSIRISGITALEFISVWNWKTKQEIRSLYERVVELFKRFIRCDKLEIFSVIQIQDRPPVVDVRYYAERQHSLLSSFVLNAVIEQNRQVLENELQLNFTQIGINECMEEESEECEEANSCETQLYLNETNAMFIDSNYSAFVGINLITKTKCLCKSSQILSKAIKSCADIQCLNGGTCLKASDKNFICKCPEGSDGPNCEVTTRSFNGQGWVWLPPMPQCSQSHISIEIITQIPNGLILYYGPMNKPSIDTQNIINDFISLELKNGMPRLLYNFGSGTQELSVKSPKPLNDGEWHTIEIFFDTQSVRLMTDHCIDAVIYDSEPLKMDRTRCESVATNQWYGRRLNVNAPLQLGGVSHQPIDRYYNWTQRHSRIGFTGCLRNLKHNQLLYDFGSVFNSANSLLGCPSVESMCNYFSRMCQNGKCLGTYNTAKCVCDPGYRGSQCETLTKPRMFQSHSFIRYSLQFDLDPYSTDIQMLFRSRESYGDLLRLSTKDKREYCILEIREARIQFRFNLNHLRSSTEQILKLKHFFVNDGEWHLVRVRRYGSTATITLDAGGVGKFASIDDFFGLHQLIRIERKNVVIGGDVSYISIGAGVVANDFDEGCLNDIRIDGIHLPMDNSTESALILESQEVVDGCPSNNPCIHITCELPFICHDIWMTYECRCPNGLVKTSDGKGCEPYDSCIDHNCMKDETPCRSSSTSRLCSCPNNTSDCDTYTQDFAINFNTIAISAYRLIKMKSNSQTNETEIEENSVECDINERKSNKVEKKAKRVRLDSNSVVINFEDCDQELDKNSFTDEQHICAEELADIIRDHIERIDLQIEDLDNVCVYALEGTEDTTVCTLSSLSSMSSIQYNIVYTTAGANNTDCYTNNARLYPIDTLDTNY
ncbi:unnamed protein product [Medioppia subpectinata]|uniref:Uncharacterized protein n=1 Tax=Medioppia subpectinata TaxID=1979941 RepID=A0A7R9KEF6_9ACAR|nr:unnamed protein product [Medioppia subpectinata]CAG2101814.1 unnamed protein product [Medioppia subpectinata]